MEEKKDIDKALAESLKQLAKKMPFEKITIRNITDGAGVIRVTFYNHFRDKYDLLESIIRNEVLEPVRVLINDQMYREALTLIFDDLKKDEDFYSRVVRIEGQNSFRDIVLHSIEELLIGLFTDYGAVPSEEHPWMVPEYLTKFYAESMTFVVINWIENGMPFTSDEMATIYEYIGNRSMMDILKELRTKKAD
jgi:probable dihydroxyacetone kinase regulator